MLLVGLAPARQGLGSDVVSGGDACKGTADAYAAVADAYDAVALGREAAQSG